MTNKVLKELIIIRDDDDYAKSFLYFGESPPNKDLAFASYYLQNESIKDIKQSINSLRTRYAENTLQDKVIKLACSKDICLYEGNGYYIVRHYSLLNWQKIMLGHVIRSSINVTEQNDNSYIIKAFYDMIDYFTDIENDQVKYKEFLEHTKEEIAKYRKYSLRRQPFFNIKKVLASLKSKRIKAWIHKDLIIASFSNVKLGNEEEGYLIYNKIYVVLKGYSIDGFLFRFKEFDYSSYWGLSVIVHPNLWLPMAFSNDIVRPISNDLFADNLKKIVKEYDSLSFKKISDIIEDFQERRKLWAGNRFLIKDREHLSKVIFSEGTK